MTWVARLKALIVKELLAVWKDPRSRLVLIGPPVVQLIVFAYAATYDVHNATVAVHDESRSAAAARLVAGFRGAPAFAEVVHLRHQGAVRPALESERADMVLHIGPDFARDLRTDPPAKVQLILDGRRSNMAQVLQGYSRAIVRDFNARQVARTGGTLPRAQLRVRAWFNPTLDSQWFIVPGLVAVLTLVVTMLVTALTVARERELGTFEQLLVTPLRPWELLLGKTLPALVIGLAEGTVILAVAVGWFGIPFTGSVGLLYAGLVVFLLSVTGVGLMISSLVGTQQQAILGAFLFLVPAVILSGFATPIANMPDWVQTLTLANPIRYFLVIVRGLFLKGLGPELVWAQMWPMLIIAAVTLVAATVLFRHRVA